ncbi:transmembrane 6 superfamily member 1-like [Littorina saxatilis]|uniref:EXPERA domain-containing protein n=1 Tax=Littorina saxatilis TaxID=31220 RepID=A0AAN9GPC6_9CAEN
MALLGPLAIFLSSLTAIPLSYALNCLSTMRDPRLILIAGVSALTFVVAVPYFVVKSRPQRADSFFFVLGIFTFSSVIDLVIALENDGIIANFMAFYLRDGEPYLKTAHGTMISYWDGVAHYAMYLMILAAQSWNQSYRDVGIYWAASIGHSMLILMPGIFMGSHGVRWPCLLNTPYVVLPFYYGAKFLAQGRPREEMECPDEPRPVATSILKRPLDFVFILYFLAAGFLAVLRFMAALGGNVQWAKTYLTSLEPYLDDASQFPKVQMMVYLFYFLPYYSACIYGLLWPGQGWMLDGSLVHAGAAAQAQFSHIGASFHYRTPFSFRVPQNGRVRLLFWLINGSLFILPQLFAIRCLNFPSFFAKSSAAEKHVEGTAVTGFQKKKKAQ